MTQVKPVLFSGIKPTGKLHLGNYFGAIRPLVELAKNGTYQTFVMVADYHALNFIQDKAIMQEYTRELIRSYLACGLSGEDIIIFKQSDVPAHTELTWIFDTITTMPYLERAHAYKDASAKGKEISVGTFNYPMLMAADVLLYDAAIVPVGLDQKQHIEYARDTAEKFNRVFKEEVFRLPEAHILEEVATVPGTDGQKMSKSYKNVIPLFGDPDEVTKAVMGIVTDSTGELPKNVYAIHSLVRSEKELQPLYEEHKGNYRMLKELLVADLNEYLAPLRDAYEKVKDSDVEEVVASGAKEAQFVSEKKMEAVRKAIGVRNYS